MNENIFIIVIKKYQTPCDTGRDVIRWWENKMYRLKGRGHPLAVQK